MKNVGEVGSANVAVVEVAGGAGASDAWETRLRDERSNAFDVIRLVLATMVVFAHSYFLVDGRIDREPLWVLSHGQLQSGQVAVYLFLCISGFLVTRSFLTSRGLRSYLLKRVARIVPGFLAATFFGLVIIAPLLATGTIQEFFARQNWPAIWVNALALRQTGVTGVLDPNPVKLVHGTLWTVKYEFDCYLLTALIGSFGLFSLRYAVFTFAAIAAVLLFLNFGVERLPTNNTGIASLLISGPPRWPELLPFYFTGAAIYVFRNYIPLSGSLFWAMSGIILISLFVGGAIIAMIFAGSYVVLYLAINMSAQISIFHRRVDLSYGLYLYAWPIQQLLVFVTKNSLSPLALFAATMPVGLCIAYVSWRFIEAPALAAVRGRRP